ncbi:helix-turn-helix domain-containing protein [Sphingomonas sp.]|uniref:helix-turn-helix domain-containing protein n=1 Tax=Sphingomonas sp. TaxID=28214 RepID=UPI0035C81635
MTLDSYLASQALTEASFAAKVGVDQSTINRVRRGHRPSPKLMGAIATATDGAVTPNDFFGLPPVSGVDTQAAA